MLRLILRLQLMPLVTLIIHQFHEHFPQFLAQPLLLAVLDLYQHPPCPPLAPLAPLRKSSIQNRLSEQIQEDLYFAS